MLSRLRTTGFAGSGALLLVLAISGAALGATVLSPASQPADDATAPLVGDTAPTVATFVDADGDGVEDSCDTDVVPDPDAAAAALAAIDADGDGVVSVREAAHSDRVGGTNCNHGGYVSSVAQEACDATVAPETPETPDAETTEPTVADEDEATEDADEATEDADEATEDADEATEDADPCSTDSLTAPEGAPVCVPVAAPVYDPALFSGPGGFGAYVATVANSDAVGGKNCNHGGAVSDAVKAAREAARAEREAAKAEARAARDAAKAERAAQRALDRAARQVKVKTRGH